MFHNVFLTAKEISSKFPSNYFDGYKPQEVVSQTLLAILAGQDYDASMNSGLEELGLISPKLRLTSLGREFIYCRYKKTPRKFTSLSKDKSSPTSSSAAMNASDRLILTKDELFCFGEKDPFYSDALRLVKLHQVVQAETIKNTFRISIVRAKSMIAAMVKRGYIIQSREKGEWELASEVFASKPRRIEFSPSQIPSIPQVAQPTAKSISK